MHCNSHWFGTFMMLTVIIIMIMIMVDHNSDGYGNRCDTWKITEIA